MIFSIHARQGFSTAKLAKSAKKFKKLRALCALSGSVGQDEPHRDDFEKAMEMNGVIGTNL